MMWDYHRRKKDSGVPLQKGMDASSIHMAVPSQVFAACNRWLLLRMARPQP